MVPCFSFVSVNLTLQTYASACESEREFIFKKSYQVESVRSIHIVALCKRLHNTPIAMLPICESPCKLLAAHVHLGSSSSALFPGCRLTAESRRGRRLYSRQDGTLCYVFSCEDLAMKATAAGFEVIESSYVRTKLLNRKTGQAMKRVFVHGVFRRRMG